MDKKKFDVVVLGGGPGGYVAAIRAAQSGRPVALIEGGHLGGTCLNRGCIPTKALLANADVWSKITHAEAFGITVKQASFDFSKMQERMDGVVTTIRGSLGGLIESHGVTIIRGMGKFVSPNEIKVQGEDNVLVSGERIIIATGSEPKNIPAFPFDGKKIHCSTSILQMKKLPKKIAIIGAGYIGCEFASLYAELGVEVVLLEALSRIIPMEADDMARVLKAAFDRKGIAMNMGVRVEGIDTSGKGVKVMIEGGDPVEADCALVSIGRQLNTDKIGLEATGIPVDRMGAIHVDEHMETRVKGIYAIGDITAKAMLAHVASHQGMVAADNAVGKPCAMHYHAVPAVVFTHPEIASVGMSPEAAAEAGYDVVTGQFPLQVLGKALASGDTEGLAQVVTEKGTGRILGAQVVGHEASALIGQMAVAIHNELTIECITETIHAHPTLAEVWLEAALVALDSPVHLPPKKKKKKKELATV